MFRCLFVMCVLAGFTTAAEPVMLKVRVTGLFNPERVPDLKELVKQWPEVHLASVNFDTSEAEFRIDADKFFGKIKPDEQIKHLDAKLRGVSHSTFGAKPLCTIPRDKLEAVQIPIVGLDCQACCLSVYETVAKLDGVEYATASFKHGRVTALIDPKKTERTKLIDALQKRNIAVGKQ